MLRTTEYINDFKIITIMTLKVSTINPRYLENSITGRTIILGGSHSHRTVVDAVGSETFDFNWYLNFLKSLNHNYIRFWVWESTNTSPVIFQRTGPGTAADGELKFDLTKYNQTYFDRVRSRAILAGSNNIYVSIMLFEGWAINNEISYWTYHPFNKTNNINGINGDPNNDGLGIETQTLQIPSVLTIQKAYIAHLIDTVNDLDNIMYEISNESNYNSISWQNELINYIHNYELTKPKQHPVIMSSCGGSEPDTYLFNSSADIIVPGGTTSYRPTDPMMINQPVSTGNKVLMVDTDHIVGYGGDKKWAWRSFCRGYGLVYMEDDIYPYPDTYTDYWGVTWDAVSARKAIGSCLSYANKMDMAKMIPTDNTTVCSTGFCLRNEGYAYLFYNPSRSSFDANVSGNIYNYEWFDCSNNVIVSSGQITPTQGTNRFTPPSSITDDSILYLTRCPDLRNTLTITKESS